MFLKNLAFKSCAYRKSGLSTFQYLARTYRSLIDVSPEVEHALQNKLPLVALESTIITHGMPHPQNVQTALEVEQIIRAEGATPVTIAVIDGRMKAGLNKQALEQLASRKPDEVSKCSRRDLPFLLSQQQTGGTTVAATMIIANMLGIGVFATGGVGGVHREGHITLDISADLVELGRTPVAVVCSGVKSILDVPRTLEYLETQGVCVCVYGSKDGHFPDFYTRESGCKVHHKLQTPLEAAKLVKSLQDLEFKSGILIGVPIPEKHAADKRLIRNAIDEAYLKSKEHGIAGKDVTPYLLAAITNITQGRSLAANIELIKNNAKVAAQIALKLSSLQTQSRQPAASNNKITGNLRPLVIGGSILDISLTMLDDMPQTWTGATYAAHCKQSAGGVARNLAEGIYKLHGQANFISSIGNDQLGKSLLKLMPKPLQAGIHIDDTKSTSVCTLIFDKLGDCKLLLGDMQVHETITPALINKHEAYFASAPLIVMDANLSTAAMECILQLAVKHQRPVFFEPTDMRIAGKPFELMPKLTQQIKIISPNLQELKTIVEGITKKRLNQKLNVNEKRESLLPIIRQMLQQIAQHFDCILVTLGHHGVLLCLRADVQQPLFDQSNGNYILQRTAPLLRFYPAKQLQHVTNVSGAGDSFSSGFITALLQGNAVERAIVSGFVAAERALTTDAAVPAQYFEDAQNAQLAVDKASENLCAINL